MRSSPSSWPTNGPEPSRNRIRRSRQLRRIPLKPGCAARMPDAQITASAPSLRHSFWEDMQALPLGCALVALGVAFFAHAGLLSGGTLGLAFLFKYWAGMSFGWMFFLINLPFY